MADEKQQPREVLCASDNDTQPPATEKTSDDETAKQSEILSEKASAPSNPPSSNAIKPVKPPPILCLGMARTGTASLGAALNILGVGRVHHGTDVYKKEFNYQWVILNRAADATFPVLPTYTGKPFTRAEWDEVFGDYDAVTDIASFYAMSLIKAYPDAKVILVERNIDRWHESIGLIFKPWASKTMRRAVRWMSPLAKSDSGPTCLKFALGWTESKRPEDIHANARAAYVRHYKEVREAVPAEQLLNLEYKDGWEPLCRFLGKEVPDVPFPHINDSAAYLQHTKETRHDIYKRVARNLCFPCF